MHTINPTKKIIFPGVFSLLFSLLSFNLNASVTHPSSISESILNGDHPTISQPLSGSGKADRIQRRQEKVQRFLKSKVGQWVIKQAIKKAEKRQYRLEKKQLKGDKEALKTLKAQKEERSALSRNLRMGLILIVVGLIALIIPGSIFAVIGSILILIGLIFVLLDLI